MQVGRINNNANTNFNGFMNSKVLLKTAEFASDNGALFAAGTALVLSAFVRPIAILATPKAQQENKEYATAKSIASSLVGFGIMALVSNPIINAVKNIEKNPSDYLNEKAIKAFQGAENNLAASSKFKFSSQMFKLGSGLVAILPKALITCALIPPLMSLFFNKDVKNTNLAEINFKDKKASDGVSFGANTGKFTNKLSELFGSIMNTQKAQNFAEKYHNTNFPQHMFSANDILATALFAKFTASNKKIKEERKKTLIMNSAIMTAFTVVGGYAVNALLKRPTEIFIEKFKAANAASPKLDKYVEGIKIAKPALILGVLYYMIAPVASTMLAEVFTKNSNRGEKC
ncbi:MAG: hypothetical protein K6A44_06955 [bacterium]|nr:hypothetical protein [bacterium]